MFKLRSIKADALSWGGWIAFLAATIGAWQFVEGVIERDALAGFRDQEVGLTDQDGVLIKDFQIKSYLGDRLVTEALVADARIFSDRSTIELKKISGGKFYDRENGEYQFEAGEAEYGTYSKSLLAKSGVRIKNKRIDLKSAGFLYDHAGQIVAVNGAVTGKLEGGDLTSQDVTILLKTNEIQTGLITWVGPVAVQGQARTPWKVEAKRSSIKSDIMTYTDARGEDKDTIVTADKMVYDRKNDIVTAEGNVTYFGIDANIKCDKAVIERKIGKATLTGRIVDMLIKPEDSAPKETGIPPIVPLVPESIAQTRPRPGGSNDNPERSSENLRQYPIVMTAGQVEYWYRKGERKAILTLQPFARQELGGMRWREVTAHRAEYDGEKDVLVLRSATGQLVRLRNSIGDDMTATFLQVSTKKGEDDMEAENLKGTVMIDENELPERPGGGAGGGGTTGTTGSTGGGGLSGPIRR